MTKAFIFDLDGVIVDTAKYHYLAWKKIASGLGIEFTHEHNELLKGVSRVRSLDIILELGKGFTFVERKLTRMIFHPSPLRYFALHRNVLHPQYNGPVPSSAVPMGRV